jgi:hypothetical protein
MKRTIWTTIVTLGLVAPIAAQPEVVTPALERRQAVELEAQAGLLPKLPVQARITTGAPYSAQAVTETVQVLSDGNRIARKSINRLYRDSQGRTRREQLAANGADVQSISISDPVGEFTYVLDPNTQTAFRNDGVIMTTPTGVAVESVAPGARGGVVAMRTPDGQVKVQVGDEDAAKQQQLEAKFRSTARASAGTFVGAGPVPPPPFLMPGVGRVEGNTTREELGNDVIEGVLATGTRTTTEIPAGAIGNERPIRIVSEQWFSEDLKVLVLTKHTDPRVGETTYRLTNIVQSEPAALLFEVPPDYTVKNSVIRRQAPLMQ